MNIKEELYSSHSDSVPDALRGLVCGSGCFDIAAVVYNKMYKPVNSTIKHNVGIKVYEELENRAKKTKNIIKTGK